jgi:hypothetical protein
LNVEGIKINNLLGKQKKSLTLATGSAGECDIDVQSGCIGGDPKFEVVVFMTQSNDQKLLEISKSINMDDISFPEIQNIQSNIELCISASRLYEIS